MDRHSSNIRLLRKNQGEKFAGAAPTSLVEQALEASRTELRAVERLLLSFNPRSSAAVLVGQFQLLLARLQAGIPVERDGVLGLLCVANKIARGVGAR